MNLIVADDEQIVRHGIGAACKQSVPSLHVWEARNGQEVMDLLDNIELDILFADIRMPHMNGLQLLEELRLRDTKTVTVIISGYEEFTYAQTALRYGVMDYLLKPAGFKQICDTLLRAVEQVQSRKNVLTMERSHVAGNLPACSVSMTSPLQAACIYIEDNFHKKISLADAARVAHVSPTHLATLFKQQLNLTFLEYVTTSKMEAACTMLMKGFQVQEIAEQLGYEDAKYFGQLFAKYTGLKPKEYRTKVLQNELE